MKKTSSSAQLFHSSSIEETNAIAARLLQQLEKTSIISLEGPLGAGKTHFVKAIAAAMGVHDEV
ncbi:MAG: tRNA (adenosine(37)-N6)-threonylcarbamoyltransferase complex ATPase subunit type 1 TsaE, partial [Verrucomicrobia bacterium]|nr:tRNA (adenosine(37)-N6)-threonylcarbamoyltransferase complex ATPase subunit type 1 TsaE [Verrucomicrobiota bacterium]